MENTLILTVGLPCAGKSYWAKEYSKKHDVPIVNIDSIRLAMHGKKFEILSEGLVWSFAKIMVRTLFLTGYNDVILDSTNMTLRSRGHWGTDPLWGVAYKVFETPLELCQQRATEKEPDNPKLLNFIENIAKNFDPLTDSDSILEDE